MSKLDDNFDTDIKRAWRDNDSGRAPTFAVTWRAAEERYARSRRQHRMLAGAAVVVAAVIVGIFSQDSTVIDGSYIEIDELMGSTSWTAPSDVLLPEHDFDIYQDLPVLLESTETAEGSLL